MPGKKYVEAKKLVDSKKSYPIDEALKLVKSMPKRGFDESIELHVRLGIDASKGDQQVRGTIAFPNGVGGKGKRVAAFVEAAKEAEAKAAGADIVGGEELVNEIASKNVIDFDVAVATPSMMPKLSKIAKILGPKGLMPNPKTDTVGPNVGKMVAEQKAGKQTFKNDPAGNLHQIFGRVSFEDAKLKENLIALIELIKKMKPASSKGIYIKTATIASTMGPAVKIELP
jgi:large subunit ribosomal protein L1